VLTLTRNEALSQLQSGHKRVRLHEKAYLLTSTLFIFASANVRDLIMWFRLF